MEEPPAGTYTQTRLDSTGDRPESLDDGARERYRCFGYRASDGVMDFESMKKLVWDAGDVAEGEKLKLDKS